MAGGGRRGHSAPSGGERVRTHMMFSEKSADKGAKAKRKRGRHKLPTSRVHQNDAMIQTGPDEEVDPSEWSGNQRVVHFGPMGNRDPFFYYYPKGWDILYPAAFGFFPYRTKTFRGSTPTVCCTAFGIFMALGGAGMTWAAYFLLYPHQRPWDRLWTAKGPLAFLRSLHPLQVCAPILLFFGLLCLCIGACWWACGLRLLSERLRHHQPHRPPPKRTIHHRPLPEVIPQQSPSTPNPYQPPPPPTFTVLPNPHTQQFLYTPESEMKLYPPVMPGYSTLSLAQASNYLGSPYNTLGSRAHSISQPPHIHHHHANEYHGASIQHKHFSDH